MMKSIKLILARRGMACGDSVMASCVLEPLARKYPQAEIHYESNFPEVFGEGFPNKRIKIMRSPKYELKDYDLVFDLGDMNKVSKVEYHAPLPHQVCSACGVPFNPPKIYCEPIKTKYSVGICPNTGRPTDTWLPEKFQELIDRVNELGFKCISFGPKDAPRFTNCRNFYPEYEEQHRNFWGYGAKGMCEEVHESARIMKGLDVVVAGDTGLLHVADAAGGRWVDTEDEKGGSNGIPRLRQPRLCRWGQKGGGRVGPYKIRSLQFFRGFSGGG